MKNAIQIFTLLNEVRLFWCAIVNPVPFNLKGRPMIRIQSSMTTSGALLMTIFIKDLQVGGFEVNRTGPTIFT